MAIIKASSQVAVGDGTVSVGGWVQDIRNLGGISFITMRDKCGTYQVTMPKKKIDPELFGMLTTLSASPSCASRARSRRATRPPPDGRSSPPRRR